MYLLNIPCVGEDLAINGLELVGSWSKSSATTYGPSHGANRERPMHALRYEVIDGPSSVAQSKWKHYRGVLGEIC
jgi:hypothetical protein